MSETTRPLIFVALLVKQKEALLEAWLKSVSEWDYPKDRMVLYVRSNNNTDRTEPILREWVERVRGDYFRVIEDYSDVGVAGKGVERFGVHEWNAERFSVLGAIRNESVRVAAEIGADYYFVCDVDNFLLPWTLSSLVEVSAGAGGAVVSPMLKNAWVAEEKGGGGEGYSNFHNVVDGGGYFQDNPEYWSIWDRRVRGLLEIDLVHCTYLIPRSVLISGAVQYVDGSGRHEYVVFSEGLRRAGVRQILDNRRPYGVLTLTENLSAVERYLTDGEEL